MHVSGRGAVTGFGAGVPALLSGIFAGERALRARRRTAAVAVAAQAVAEFPADPWCEGIDEASLPGAAAVAAAREALAEAWIDAAAVGLVLATTKAELTGIHCPGDGLASPMRLARRVAVALGCRAVLGAVSCACASGLAAIAMAARRIASGREERVLVVGTDAINQFILAGFSGMHILDPQPCRPFDAGRRGISLGDGAGALVLSAREAESVGMRVAGFGGGNDACHVTACDREGGGLAVAAERALVHAGMKPADIDLVHLHGTGTLANDSSEARGLARVFGGRTPPAVGSKAQLGHTLGAAGIIESLIAIAALQRGMAPANVGLDTVGVDDRLALVRAPRQLSRSRSSLKVAGGFGGLQQAVVFAS